MQKQSFILREALRLKIDEVFKKEGQSRVLFIHQDLLQLLNFAYEFKISTIIPNEQIVLFENDTEAIDDFKATTLVFFLNPITTAIKTLSSIILRNESRAISKRYILYFIPKIDNFCMDELVRAGLTHKVEVNSFSFGLISVSRGLTSLQLSPYTHPVEVENFSVEALLKMSKLTGILSNIIGKGEKARAILEQYERQVQQEDQIDQSENNCCLIVLERKLDPVSPLLTGHSYEALLDHFFGIHYNKILVPASLLGGVGEEPVEYLLHNQRDPVYEEIAYLCIEEARDQIQRRAALMKKEFEFKRLNTRTEEDRLEVNRVRVQYEQVYNHMQLILQIISRMNQLHCYNLINIEASLLKDSKADFEELHYLTLEYPPELILRLICLYSQVYPNANFYTRFEKEILEVVAGNYSPTHITSLYLLQKAGFLRNSKARSKWEQFKLSLDLLPQDPHPYTQVHITYSAIAVRFIQLILTHKLTPQLSALIGKDNFLRCFQKEREVKEVYVFFVGGITYSEISCLRLLEKAMKVNIHILTTNVSSGQDMIGKIINNPDL